MKHIKCRSGLDGWQATLHDNYENNYEHWLAYADMYGIHLKLGYKTPQMAWKKNPVIQGSVLPEDFCKIVHNKRVFAR